MSLTKIPIALLADGTDGNIISFDASGNPVAVATGNSGQVFTSAGAGSPPAFAAAAAAGLNFVGSTTASDDASITVSGLDTTYDMYLIGINDLKIASDAQDIHMRFGDSGGIDSGGADYAWIGTAFTSDADNTGSTSDPKGSEDSSDGFICISGQNNAVGNAATEGFSGLWTLSNTGAGTNLPSIIGNYNNTNQSTGVTIGMTGGHRRAKISVTSINIFAQSGNLTSGTLVVWGLSKS